jgi:uncharacterized membrane protein
MYSVHKTITYSAASTALTMLVLFLCTGNIVMASAIGIFDRVAKVALYYFHEKAWSRHVRRRRE